VLPRERVEVEAQLAFELVLDGVPVQEQPEPVAKDSQAAHRRVRLSGAAG
jgi:hypothetical protein